MKKTLMPGIYCLALLAATGLAYTWARDYDARRLQTAFDQLAATKAQRVLLRVEGFERTLYDLRGLFVADTEVTEAQFMRYLDGIQITDRYPALRRIGYAPLVTPANRKRLRARFAAKGVRLDEPRANGDMQAPVLYGYPFSGGVLGQDLNADAPRHESLATARDTNSARISAAVPLRFSADLQPGYLLYVPLYEGGTLQTSIAARRRALNGFVYAAFRADELIASVIQDGLGTQFDVSLYDGDKAAPAQAVFSSLKTDDAAPTAHDPLTSTQQLFVGGRPWTFVFHARPDFLTDRQSLLLASILVGGSLISLLGFWLVWIIQERLAAEKRIVYMALHDELSGLPNRTLLRSEIERAIDTDAPHTAVLIVELTHVGEINYTLGHTICDELIRLASSRIRSAMSHYIVARISTLQFAVVADGCNGQEAVAMAERLIKSFEHPLRAEGISYEVGAHIGIAMSPDHGTDSERLMRHADVALNQARTLDLAVVLYDPDQDPYQPRRLSLLREFREALKSGQIELYCQPKAKLRCGTINSVEVLVRWQHPDYGLVPPDEFIPLIEPTALVHPLIKHVFSEALQQSRLWHEQDLDIKMAVNLSTRNLLNPQLPRMFGELLRQSGGDASWIELEITESSLMRDPTAALHILQQLHDMGLTLSVDDYGTGYSGLDYLLKFPIQTIKIDRAFTVHMTENRDAAAIVKSTIGLAHEMGMRVVAEGIENRLVWDALDALGCDEVQGYYVGAPMPIRDFVGWLRESPWHYNSRVAAAN